MVQPFWLLCCLLGGSAALAAPRLEVGEQVRMPDGRLHVVTASLGAGGSRRVYELKRVGCSRDCRVIMGVFKELEYSEDLHPASMRQVFEAEVPYVRAEPSLVFETTFKGEPMRFMIAEHADSVVSARTLKGLRRDPEAFRIIGQQMYAGVDGIAAAGAFNFDIKTSNFLWNGPVSAEAVRSGWGGVLMSDLEGLLAAGTDLRGLGRMVISARYLPPEVVRARRLNEPLKLTEKQMYWQVALSLVDAREDREPPFTELIERYWRGTSSHEEIQVAVEEFKRSYGRKLDLEIHELGQAGDPRVEDLKVFKKMVLNGLEMDPEHRVSHASTGLPIPDAPAARSERASYVRSLATLASDRIRNGGRVIEIAARASALPASCLARIRDLLMMELW